jgi:thiosulfate/3-mercaptopyruvate sulfurtransferase
MSSIVISPEQLATLMSNDKVIVVDTRAPEAYAAGHLPGAVNLREIFTFLASSTAEGLQELKEKFIEAFESIGVTGEQTVVFYEDSLSSGYGQSCRGYFLLNWLNYPKAAILDGGVAAWKGAGFDLSTDAVAPARGKFPETGTAPVMLTKDDVKQAIEEMRTLLDVRDADEWVGESSSPYGKDFAPRKGRLPNAKWIEWYRFMKPSAVGPKFKTELEVLAECASAGVKKTDPVYLYCFKGARASNTYVALKQAGFEDVRIYFGSWNEWSRDSSLPIDEGLLSV